MKRLTIILIGILWMSLSSFAASFVMKDFRTTGYLEMTVEIKDPVFLEHLLIPLVIKFEILDQQNTRQGDPLWTTPLLNSRLKFPMAGRYEFIHPDGSVLYFRFEAGAKELEQSGYILRLSDQGSQTVVEHVETGLLYEFNEELKLASIKNLQTGKENILIEGPQHTTLLCRDAKGEVGLQVSFNRQKGILETVSYLEESIQFKYSMVSFGGDGEEDYDHYMVTEIASDQEKIRFRYEKVDETHSTIAVEFTEDQKYFFRLGPRAFVEGYNTRKGRTGRVIYSVPKTFIGWIEKSEYTGPNGENEIFYAETFSESGELLTALIKRNDMSFFLEQDSRLGMSPNEKWYILSTGEEQIHMSILYVEELHAYQIKASSSLGYIKFIVNVKEKNLSELEFAHKLVTVYFISFRSIIFPNEARNTPSHNIRRR